MPRKFVLIRTVHEPRDNGVAAPTSGTACARLFFDLSAGMVHTPLTRSTSRARMPATSPGRCPVNRMSVSASRLADGSASRCGASDVISAVVSQRVPAIPRRGS